MSDSVIAKMWIGGRLSTSRALVLIAAINDTQVFATEGDLYFQPHTTSDLMQARTHDGQLYLCDDEAPWGEMEIMTETCRRLGLTYKHWHEASSDGGSTISVWAPGMNQPVCYPSDHFDHGRIFVNTAVVGAALKLLRTGKTGDAIEQLEGALPSIPNIPPFEIVEDEVFTGKSLSSELAFSPANNVLRCSSVLSDRPQNALHRTTSYAKK